MRILVTGMTAIHVGLPRSDSPLVSMVVKALRLAGHEVDNRVLRFEELLTGVPRYHRVICFLSPISDLHVTNVLDALCLLANRPDAITAIDDWQVAKIWATARSVARHGDKYLFESVICRGRHHAKLLTEAHKEAVRRGAAELNQAPYPRKVLIPLFPWGSIEGLEGLPACQRVIPYDPTALTPTLPFKRVATRRRAWTLAALGDRTPWLRKLNPTWPIERLGYPEKRVDESVVVQSYAETRGMLVPRYRHVKSGWWRPRFKHAVDAGSIAYVMPDEAIALALPGYHVHADDLNVLEASTDGALNYRAKLQAASFKKAIWTEEKLVETLKKAVR